jgi:hypothetical protein
MNGVNAAQQLENKVLHRWLRMLLEALHQVVEPGHGARDLRRKLAV